MSKTTHQTKPRQTRQRGVICEALSASHSFISAQQLYANLRERGESIGLATVYRTLQSLAEMGQADTVRTTDGEVLYRSCSNGHHHHIICRVCGSAVEVDGGPIENWADTAALEHGFHQVSHELEIYGTCSLCWSTGE